MNAVICLCHFCEAHGPAAIFCTQTLRNTKIDELNFYEQQLPNQLCAACNSLGKLTGIVSKDETSNANFLSSQTPVLPEVCNLIKQASVRSLSCEIGTNKDGGFVFFGDAVRGHVLSHTFHVSDIQARGFYQLFSIIIVMKDKFFLLNIQPFLAEHLKKISEELQSFAKIMHDKELSRSSARDRRLSGTGQIIPSTPRSLIDLTGEENIFAILHSHFSWILLAGSSCLTEHITFGNLPWIRNNNNNNGQLQRQIINFTETGTVNLLAENIKNEMFLNQEETVENLYSLRRLKDILECGFTGVCYCIITGIKVVVRGPIEKANLTIMCLKHLLPQQMHKLIQTDSQYLTNSDCKIIAVLPEIAVPMPSNLIYRIDFLDDKISIKWLGEVPNKRPDLLTKILKAVDEPLFTNIVLYKQIKVLVEEWKK